jgi:hypothetical protein
MVLEPSDKMRHQSRFARIRTRSPFVAITAFRRRWPCDIIYVLRKTDLCVLESNLFDHFKYIHYLSIVVFNNLKINEMIEIAAHVVRFRGEIIWDKSEPDGTSNKQLDISHLSAFGWQAKSLCNKAWI